MRVSTFLWHYISKLKVPFFGLLIFEVIGESCRQIGIYYGSRIVGVLGLDAPRDTILHHLLWLVFIFTLFIFARSLFANLSDLFFNARITPVLRARLSKDLFATAHKHALQFFNEEMSGRVASKINRTISDVFQLHHNFMRPFISLMRLIIGFAFIMNVNMLLGFILLIFVALYMFIIYLSSRKLSDYSTESHNNYSIANGVMIDTLFNYTLLKNDGKMPSERLHFFKKLRPWIYSERKVYATESFMYMTQGALRGVMQIIFLFITLSFWLNGTIGLADFVLVESLITYLTMFALDTAGVVARFCRSWGGIADGLNFLYTPFTVTDKSNAVPLKITRAPIEFKDVTFYYQPTFRGKSQKPKRLFHHFNLTIKTGDKVGLIGSSGSGKSSLIKLINRYYDILNGEILIDGKNIADVTQDSLRAHIALIPQDPSLFSRTLMENIRYGNPSASDRSVINAAKRAYAHDFIMRLPNGYQTKVGERGITLSGGERQRIAIARAILKNAPILILDEATSALDSESEIFIQKALQEIMKKKTVIAIAHRLSTLREMDYLLVMDKGQIIEKGTHTALLKKKGAYHDFYHLQTDNFKGHS